MVIFIICICFNQYQYQYQLIYNLCDIYIGPEAQIRLHSRVLEMAANRGENSQQQDTLGVQQQQRGSVQQAEQGAGLEADLARNINATLEQVDQEVPIRFDHRMQSWVNISIYISTYKLYNID